MVLRYSLGFYPFFDTRPDFYFFGTRPDSTLSRYSPEPFSDTHPDPSPVVARIPPFWYSPGFLLFRYSLGFYLFGTRLDFYLSSTQTDPSLVLSWISTFPTLTWIQPSQYSPRPFSGTRLDFYFSGTRPNSTFPVLAQILPS